MGLHEKMEPQQTQGEFALTCRIFSTDFWKMLTKRARDWGKDRDKLPQWYRPRGRERPQMQKKHISPIWTLLHWEQSLTPLGDSQQALPPTEHKRKPTGAQEQGKHTKPLLLGWGREEV